MKLTLYKTGYIFDSGKVMYYSGSTPSAHSSNVTEFELVETLEGRPAYVKYWMMQYELISAEHKSIIEAVMGNLTERILTENLRYPEHLLNIAINKLAQHGEKHMKVCSRCGGSGHYSYNQMYGTVCFKCNGMKYLLPSERQRTKKWMEQVRETFTQKESKCRNALDI